MEVTVEFGCPGCRNTPLSSPVCGAPALGKWELGTVNIETLLKALNVAILGQHNPRNISEMFGQKHSFQPIKFLITCVTHELVGFELRRAWASLLQP